MKKHYSLMTVFVGILALSQVAQGAFLPVCERTEPVKKNLEAQLKKTCDLITEADLLTLKRVAVQNAGVKEFKTDDFTGLKNLEILNIRSNPNVELPEGMFKDLGNLKTLVIIANTQMRHFPDDFLADTPLMEHLHVFRLAVRSLSESVLVRLENLKNIQEIDMDDDLPAAEKARLRRIFPENGKVQFIFN
jgi:hypothetical protein